MSECICPGILLNECRACNPDAEANAASARLIAAAPDLLAALIEARRLIDLTHPEAARVHNMATDALAKATGE